jgi:O-succinylhomoserine sulfhydrylase
MKPDTQAIRIQTEQTSQKEHSTPLYLTSSFTFDDAEQMRAAFADEAEENIYSRFSNPNCQELIDKMCALEGAEAGFVTASGMSAVFAGFMALLKSGDHILSSGSVFGSTHTVITKFLPRWGISHSYADMNKPEDWEGLIQENTKMIFVESPSNPGLDIIDLHFLGALAKKHHIILNVDNCFATPASQMPIAMGADLVTHSATKYIDGQGRVLGGIMVGRKDLIKEIFTFCRSTGPALSPFNAWVLSKSLETLSLRMEKHSENAMKFAEHFQNNPDLDWLKYPFLPSHPQYAIAKKQMRLGGGIVTFQLKGGIERGKRFLDALKMASLTANLGDTRTIVTHPASTTHSKLTDAEREATGITAGLVRISIGLENISDILEDIGQAISMSR